MTRQEILEAYDVDANGVIRSPGKFEAECVYAPHFYDASLDGSADILDWSDGTSTYLIDVDENDRTEFPELSADTVTVAIQESDQGFVDVVQLTAAQLDKLRSDNEEDAESDDSDDDC